MVFTAAGLGLAPAEPAAAAALDHEKEYRACIRLAQTNPAKAQPAAEYWAKKGGGSGARHCLAVAMVGNRKPAQAAALFEKLGSDQTRPPEARAQMLAQGAQAWVLAKNPKKAIATLDRAVALAPNVAAYRIDRAVAHAASGQHQKTLEDLNAALKIDPDNAEAYTFRASAYRFTGDLASARADIERALTLAPQRGDALLERGVIKVMTGDRAGGRADWQAIVQMAPGSPLARAAQENLARLEQPAGGAPASAGNAAR